MKKCPYCFEEITTVNSLQCPHCNQHFIDPLIDVDYKSFEKKRCVFCGKNIFKEARVCKYCRKWIDEVDDASKDYDTL